MSPAPIAIETLPAGVPIGIFGAGGHGREIAWLLGVAGIARERCRFVVDAEFLERDTVAGIPVMTSDAFSATHASAPMIVAVGDPQARRAIVGRLSTRGHSFPSLNATRMTLSSSVTLGAGVVLFPGTILTVDIALADHVHVNVNCSLSHDVRIGEFSTLSPRSTICGRVQIGSGVFVGAGTCIVNGSDERPIAVGDNARIAAGSVVIGSVDADAFVAGVPAVRKR